LQQSGHIPVFAGNDTQQAFVRRNFSRIELHPLPGYEVRYGRRALMLHLLQQVPGLLRRVREEHRWLRAFAGREGIDGIISDNRYGLWHPEKPSVILTHQPGIISGLGHGADAALRRLHYRFLQRFNEVWIPDLPGPNGLGGRLSHPAVLPRDARYIGWLSQFHRESSSGKNEHLLILLSGPEPQRSMLSDMLWQQTLRLSRPAVFVEGKTGISREAPPHIRHIALADASQLQPLLRDASLVVCRSGYSTLMDLVQFGKPAILIPTPGQTEQEYLAETLAKQGLFHAGRQQNFSLENVLAKAETSPRRPPVSDASPSALLEAALRSWLARF
jgi:UDP-N-acetylglucosamine transferase subunit ALG13